MQKPALQRGHISFLKLNREENALIPKQIFMPGISERAYSCRTGIKWIVWVNSMNFNALEKSVVWQNLCMKSLEEFFREKSQFLFAFLKTWIKESLHRIINLPSPWNFSSFGIINISRLSPYFLNCWEKKKPKTFITDLG